MTKTFNRTPLTINTPSSSDVKDYFFTHGNWKGLSDDKNFLTVDQETFSNCDNEYMDTEGLLKSRPAMKRKDILITTSSGQTSLSGIINTWKFDDVTVYHSQTSTNYLLTFVNPKFDTCLQIQVDENAKLINVERTIFIFTSRPNSAVKLWYYDLDGTINTIYAGTDRIYAPVTKIVSGGIEKELESENEFTDSHYIRYLYDNIADVNFAKFEGKNIKVYVGSDEHELKITEYTKYILVNKVSARPFNCMYTDGDMEYPNISVSNKNTFIITETLSDGSYTIYYSVNGKSFSVLPKLDNMISMPVITHDGNYVIALTPTAINVCKVLEDELDEYAPMTWYVLEKLTGFLFNDNSSIDAPSIHSFAAEVVREYEEDYVLDCIVRHNDVFTTYSKIISYALSMDSVGDVSMVSTLDDFLVIINVGTVFFINNFQPEPLGIKTYYTTGEANKYPKQLDVIVSNSNPGEFYICYWQQTDNQYQLMRDGYLYDSKTNTWGLTGTKVIKSLNSFDKSFSAKMDANGNVLTAERLYLSKGYTDLLQKAYPVSIKGDYIYNYSDGYLYSNFINDTIIMEEYVAGIIHWISPDLIAELDNYYLTSGKTLYISSYTSDEQFKWYFPKINTEQLDYTITNMHPISQKDMAVFTEDSVYYITNNYNSELLRQEYYYYKSKLQVGCKAGGDVITTYDGKYILFSSERGLVATGYQDFVASTEQVLTYLSDSIHDYYKDFSNNEPVRLYKKDFYIICYKENSPKLLIFDIRNNSWWPITLPWPIKKLVNLNNETLSIGDCVYYSDKSSESYYDYNGQAKKVIDWSILSQKLYLSYPNYYKHISSMTLTSVLEGAQELHLDLTLYNYRKRIHTSDVESFNFSVDSVRVFVKRLNYFKVNEFQYLLTSDVNDTYEEQKDDVPKIALSLSNIVIKYKIAGQVR